MEADREEFALKGGVHQVFGQTLTLRFPELQRLLLFLKGGRF